VGATSCPQCGAPPTELLCRFCGAPAGALESLDDELRALRLLHSLVQYASKAQQLRFVRTGFVPQHPSVLVEAALQCFVLLRDGDADEVSDAAAERLAAIATRLRLGRPDEPTRRALAEIDERLARFRRGQRQLAWMATALVLFVLVAGGWVWMTFFRKH
jgi:hypothetical protein